MLNTMEMVKTNIPHPGILHIQLNRPQQLNALSEDVLALLLHVFQRAKTDPTIRALFISGEGKAFCAGADIKQLAELDGPKALLFARQGQAVFRTLETLGKPSIAAIHGFAFGGGCELAMAATMRIAAENTMFGQPEINLGVIPGFGGTQRLSRLIGQGRALDICLTGRRFSAAEAHQWGMVAEVTPDEEVQDRALAILKKLITFPPIALSSIMTVIDQGYNLSLEEALELEAVHFALCCTTEDKKEGVDAFLNKRTPVFHGE